VSRVKSTPGDSVIQSWLTWARTAKNYGMQMWLTGMKETKESTLSWISFAGKLQVSVVVKAFKESMQAAMVQRDENYAARAASVKRDARLMRMVTASTLHSNSEAGKLMMREASQHWAMSKMIHSIIAWMNHSQVIMLQTCLNYSAKTHYIHESSKKAYLHWRAQVKALKTQDVAGTETECAQGPVSELEKKARRLSLQEQRCVVNLQRRKEERHSLGGKVFFQSREEMLLTPPPTASPKFSAFISPAAATVA